MKQIIYILITTVFFISCEIKETANAQKINIELVRKSKEERRIEREEREGKRQQLIAEKKEKYKYMTSVNRVPGDIRGIWYMEGEDIKNMRKFLNSDLKGSDGYCINISDDMKNGKIYFLSNKMIFEVKIEKISETKYSMTYINKQRFFEVLNLSNRNFKDSKGLIWFFEDSHKFNPNKGSEQFHDGMNFYDFCSRISEHECTVEGCLDRIKTMDEIGDPTRGN